MREHRHARLGLHAPDETLAAARHDHVDAAVETGEHQPDGRAVARRHQLNRIFRQARDAQAFDQRRMDRARGAEAFRAAAQDHGIAGLEAEHGGIRRHVRAALVDDTDDAERHAHALDRHAVRPGPAFHHGADRIGELAHHLDAVGHRGDALRVERQPVDEGRGRAGGLRLGDIFGVGGKDAGFAGADRFRHRVERGVAMVGRAQRQRPRGATRAAADIGHRGGDAGAFNGFQGRGHGGGSLAWWNAPGEMQAIWLGASVNCPR